MPPLPNPALSCVPDSVSEACCVQCERCLDGTATSYEVEFSGVTNGTCDECDWWNQNFLLDDWPLPSPCEYGGPSEFLCGTTASFNFWLWHNREKIFFETDFFRYEKSFPDQIDCLQNIELDLVWQSEMCSNFPDRITFRPAGNTTMPGQVVASFVATDGCSCANGLEILLSYNPTLNSWISERTRFGNCVVEGQEVYVTLYLYCINPSNDPGDFELKIDWEGCEDDPPNQPTYGNCPPALLLEFDITACCSSGGSMKVTITSAE